MNKNLSLALSVILGMLILYFLFRKTDFKSFILIFSITSIYLLIISLVFFFFIKIINVYRYSELYRFSNKTLAFGVLCYSNFMLSIMPFRVGEFSYLHGFKKYFNITYSEGAKNLIFLRFIDYVITFVLLLISSFYVTSQIKGDYLKVISIVFLSSLICVLFFIIFLLRTKKLKLRNKFVNKYLSIIRDGISELIRLPKSKIIKIFYMSIIYWLLRLLMGYILLLILGLDISFMLYCFISLVLLLIGMIPVQTFMNFGIFEGGWSYFLVLVGFKYEEVLPLILNYHLILILIPLVYGIVGYVVVKYSASK